MNEEKDYKHERRQKLNKKRTDKFKKEGKPKLFEKGRNKKWKYEG